ncbi:Protease production enhancer protein [Variovorax sp. PBS-H4]|uniref:response regulator transcription factor n=1 Tax=Variovorax sp. PBS-H4 TaxID=434008 RepID=UPI0013160CB8|nr:response regulator transcription factor [Variovorax sp. PBS-H4]VTU27254.1 Protease production enhancer protein [Variovorax sp. PBS-H4]
MTHNMISAKRTFERSSISASEADRLAGDVELKILVADDHHLVREGLKLALLQIGTHTQVLEAATLTEAIETFHASPDIDLILLDLSMPGAAGLSGLDVFLAQCPAARLVVVSATHDMKTVQAAIKKGALGFIPKSSGKQIFLSALRFILDGGIYVPPEPFISDGSPQEADELPSRTTASFSTQASAKGLTHRQIDVLRELLEGNSNKQICRNLNLAMGTVKAHVAAVLSALSVNTRAEAIAAADRLGLRQLVDPPSSGRPATHVGAPSNEVTRK